jgi:drug/metabolite transporter (DMT)-like permease
MLPASPFNKICFTLAMLFGAAVPVITQSLNFDNVHPAYTAFARAALALVLIVAIAAITLQSPLSVKPRDWFPLGLAGVFLGASWYCHVRAIQLAHVPSAEAAFAIYPLVAILIMRQSSYHLSYILLLFVALIGVTLALPDIFVMQTRANLGVAYSLGSAILLALSGGFATNVYKFYPPDRHHNAIMLVQYLFAALFLAPVFLITPPPALTAPIAGKLIAIGLVISSLSRLLMSSSARRMNPAHSVLILALQPFVAITIAAIAYPESEMPTVRIIIAAVIITLCSLAASTIQRVGPAAIFKPIRWN